MATPRAARASVRRSRTLLYVAMALFCITIAIGILNGLDLVEFNRDQLLTHVHSGTLGWVTPVSGRGVGLAVRAAAIDGWPSRSAILIPVYVVAFYLGNLPFRAISGTALLVAIVWLVIWAWQSYRARRVAAGARRRAGLGDVRLRRDHRRPAPGPDGQRRSALSGGADIIGAHAGTMVFSYLILVAMGLIEWQVREHPGRPTSAWSSWSPCSAAARCSRPSRCSPPDQVHAIGGIYLLVELIAIVLFVVRILPTPLRVDWMARPPRRHLATSSIFVIVSMGAYMYLVVVVLVEPDRGLRDVPADPDGQRSRHVHRRDHEPRVRPGPDADGRPPDGWGHGGAGGLRADERRPGDLPHRARRPGPGPQADRRAGDGRRAADRAGRARDAVARFGPARRRVRRPAATPGGGRQATGRPRRRSARRRPSASAMDLGAGWPATAATASPKIRSAVAISASLTVSAGDIRTLDLPHSRTSRPRSKQAHWTASA